MAIFWCCMKHIFYLVVLYSDSVLVLVFLYAPCVPTYYCSIMTTTTTRNRHSVSITTTYWIPTEPPESVVVVDNVFATTRHATLGLPTTTTTTSSTTTVSSSKKEEEDVVVDDVVVVPTKPPAGSFTYSGMHDQGPLVSPREGGDMAILIACCEDAKAHTDEYLTQVIMANNQHHHFNNTNNNNNNMGAEIQIDRQAKKMKLEDEEK